MRFVGKLALVLFACKLDDGTFECGDWTCPNGTACLNPPEANVHCVSLLCGNGVVDPNEQCDGEVAQTCLDLQFDAGHPQCTAHCTLDTSACAQIGFESRFEGSTRVGKFCAYESDGRVVGHFFQDDVLYKFDDKVEELPGTFDDVPADLACTPNRIGAISQSRLATYSQGTWTRANITLDDGTPTRWKEIVETDVDLTAIGWAFFEAGGYGGIIAAADGVGWNVQAKPTAALEAIGSRGGQTITALEGGHLLKRAANGVWATLSSLSPFYGTVTALAVVSPDNVIASNTRALMEFRSGAWTSLFPISPGRIAASSRGSVFVSGNDGSLAHFDELIWSRIPSIGTFDEMWLASTGELYASRASELLHATALWFELPAFGIVHAIATIAGRDVLVTYRPGSLYLTQSFTNVDSRITALATSGSVAFGVGGAISGYAIRLDLTQPATWTTGSVTPAGTVPLAVVAAIDRAWAVGTNGRLVEYNNGWLAPIDTMLGVTLRGIGRTQGGELIAVGDGGTIATSTDGVTWTRADLGLAVALRAVFTRGDDVFVVGERGTIAQRVGGTWSVAAPTNRDLVAIHGGGTRLVAVGDRTIVEFDGTRWSPVRTPLAGSTFTTVIVRPPHVYVGSATKSFVLYRP